MEMIIIRYESQSFRDYFRFVAFSDGVPVAQTVTYHEALHTLQGLLNSKPRPEYKHAFPGETPPGGWYNSTHYYK